MLKPSPHGGPVGIFFFQGVDMRLTEFLTMSFMGGRDEMAGAVAFKSDVSVYPHMTKANVQDAGYDVVAAVSKVIPAFDSQVFATRLYVAIPPGHVGILFSRSGLSIRHRVEVGAGVIDSGYRGEIVVHLYNHGPNPYQVHEGDRIAQMLIFPVFTGAAIRIEELPEGDRGENGFGSSGR